MSDPDFIPAPALDAHGFDPGDYDWLPVPRAPRHDGWSISLQRQFIETLADTGSVAAAAKAVGKPKSSAYRLRREPGAEQFAAAWDAALAEASKQLTDVAFDRAFNGIEEPVVDKAGNHIYTRQRYSDRLLMFLLRAHHPERYGAPNEGRSGAALMAPVARALAALAPVPPAEPHLLMAPDVLADLAWNSDVMSGDAAALALPQTPASAALPEYKTFDFSLVQPVCVSDDEKTPASR